MIKRSYKQLFIWQAAMDVAVITADIADELCARRRFALADQLQRSSISIPSNIAEGHGRLTARDQRHFLSQARGSTYELETQLELAIRIGKISAGQSRQRLITLPR